MFAYVGLRNALPHSSDRKGGGGNGVGTGWGGGDDGVGTGGSAAGGAALITFGYHRRPPARTRAGLRGRRPDLRATAHAADPSNSDMSQYKQSIRAHAKQKTISRKGPKWHLWNP